HGQAEPPRVAPKRLEFVRRVNRTDFRSLGEREGARFRVMNVGAPGHGAFDRGGLDLPVLSRGQQDLRAVRKKFRRPALRNLYVRDLLAENAMVRLAERRERQRNCRATRATANWPTCR